MTDSEFIESVLCYFGKRLRSLDSNEVCRVQYFDKDPEIFIYKNEECAFTVDSISILSKTERQTKCKVNIKVKYNFLSLEVSEIDAIKYREQFAELVDLVHKINRERIMCEIV